MGPRNVPFPKLVIIGSLGLGDSSDLCSKMEYRVCRPLLEPGSLGGWWEVNGAKTGAWEQNPPQSQEPPTTVLFLYISMLETMDLQLCDPWNSKNVFSPGRAPAAMPLPTPTPQDSSPFAFRSW